MALRVVRYEGLQAGEGLPREKAVWSDLYAVAMMDLACDILFCLMG
jgi:hypothetical protein